MKDSYKDIFGNKTKVMVVMAHPDDAEIVCGGTVARLIAEGKKVRLVVTTDGAKGIGDKEIDLVEFKKRRFEDQVSGGVALGLFKDEIFNLGLPDGEVENTVENIGMIAYHIREFKPEIIITHNPQDVLIKVYGQNEGWVNHRDHLITGMITCFAAYPYARDHAFFPEQVKQGLKGHTVKELLFADSYQKEEKIFFDIGGFLKQKKEGISKHFLPEAADEYIEENKTESGYFEVLGFYKIY
ncbi:MAG: LmbE family protein [Microgenomates group bacterium GW2011_GWA1_Microgenomates_45_10]|nr:MAG: LmbE family protein [Microgenomates group bacterium GW2011_GWA2_44_7]KKT77610.1 MAG: LmbE family protein [Microgenomates group bacterium GW2011_GWB1_44_8]KKT87279.1 MAG: LmbE family protein [Microgenomates group bacterium GW2011_GWA1_Microgenomates_45_10]